MSRVAFPVTQIQALFKKTKTKTRLQEIVASFTLKRDFQSAKEVRKCCLHCYFGFLCCLGAREGPRILGTCRVSEHPAFGSPFRGLFFTSGSAISHHYSLLVIKLTCEILQRALPLVRRRNLLRGHRPEPIEVAVA